MSFSSSLAKEINLYQRQNKHLKKQYFQTENPEREKKEKRKAQPGRQYSKHVPLICGFSGYFLKHSSATAVKRVSDGIEVSNQKTLTYKDYSRLSR